MLSKASEDEDEGAEPQRDERGRFKKGASGNPTGRPRKPPQPPWSLERSLKRELAERVPVALPDGTRQDVTMMDLIIKSVVRGAPKAKLTEQMKIFDWLAKQNVLGTFGEELDPKEELYSDEDRRLLDELSRSVFPYCCQCDKPVMPTSTEEPKRGDFSFE